MPLPNPCSAASCPWGPFAPKDHSHSGGCLAGVCSEPTTFNVADEVARVVGGMPRGRRILGGYYATGHSSGGQGRRSRGGPHVMLRTEPSGGASPRRI